ncbi:unnamed protein product, partial [Ixodes hexagonus]
MRQVSTVLSESFCTTGYHPGYGAHLWVLADPEPVRITAAMLPAVVSPLQRASFAHVPVIPLELADLAAPPPSYQFRMPDTTRPPPPLPWWVGGHPPPHVVDGTQGLSTSRAYAAPAPPVPTTFPADLQRTSGAEECQLEALLASLSLDDPLAAGSDPAVAPPRGQR